jgi:putative ABC transport system permease protein
VAANVRETVKHGDQKFENVNVRGVTPTTMFDIDGRAIDVGRIWTDAEGVSGREICVVGPDVLTNLFGGASADRVIGQEVRIAGRPFQIIGVLEPLGSIRPIKRFMALAIRSLSSSRCRPQSNWK